MGVVGGVGGEKLCIGTGGKPDVCIMARNLHNVIRAGAFGGSGGGGGGGGGETSTQVGRCVCVCVWGGGGGGGERGEEGGGRGKDAAKPWDKNHYPPPLPAQPPTSPPSLSLSNLVNLSPVPLGSREESHFEFPPPAAS